MDNDEDHAVDNKQLRLSATASGGLGIADPDEVTLTIKDDDKAGVNFSTSEIEVEKDETTVFQVRLTSQPTMDTTVILTSNNPNVAELSASPRGRRVELLFTPENWNVPQQVTVHGMDDGEVSIDTTIQSADPMYAKAPAPKPLQTNVIGVPNLTLTASQDYVREGNAATFTIEADRVSAVDVPVKIEVAYLDCCIGTGEILAEGEYGVRTVTLPQGQTSVSFKVQTADDDEFHGKGARPGNKSIYARIVETDAYRIDHTGNDELARFTWQDSVSVRENDPIPPDPPAEIIVSVSGPERVMEGDTAEFTFTASKAPESDLVISFYLDSAGDFDTTPAYAFDPAVLSGLEKETVTLPAGALETTFSLTIIDDGETQGHGRMSVRVSSGRNNSYDSADPPGLYVFFDVIDDETSPPGESQQPDPEQPDPPQVENTDTACVPADLLDYVDERIDIATTDRWERIKNALTGQPNAIGLAEVRSIYQNRKANGWTLQRLDEVIEALECLESDGSTEQTDSQDPPPAATPVVSIQGGNEITEGGDAAFTIELDTALETALTVQLEVADDRDNDFLAAGDEGSAAVTIPAGKTSASFSVATVDDEVDESDGYVRVSVVADAAYDARRGDDEYDEVRVRDDDTSISLSVDDVEIREARGAKLVFTVRLSEEAYEEVWVNFDSRDVTAKAGEDYARASGTLIFPPFETERQVEVIVYDDEHDEGAETMELVLSGGSGAKLGKVVGVGTIINTDPMPKAWLGRFGLSIAEQVVDGLSRRWDAPRAPGLAGRIGGVALASASADSPFDQAPGMPGQAWPPGSHWAGDKRVGALGGPFQAFPSAGARLLSAPAPGGATALAGAGGGFPGAPLSAGALAFPGAGGGSGPVNGAMPGSPVAAGSAASAGYGQQDSLRALLVGSDFTVNGALGAEPAATAYSESGAADSLSDRGALEGGAPDAAGKSPPAATWSLWGGFNESRFRGEDGKISLDGNALTGMFGADLARGNWIAGVGLNYSEGEGGYGAGGQESVPGGSLRATVGAITPYGRLRLSGGREVWGTFGFGGGTMELSPAGGVVPIEAGLGWRMAAAGGEQALLKVSDMGGLELSAKADVLWARTTSDQTAGLVATSAAVSRTRLGLEAAWNLSPGGLGNLRPMLEASIRHDAGDADSGLGIDVSGGLAWQAPDLGLDVSLRGRGTASHESGGFRQWSYGASVSYDPDTSSERGLLLKLGQELGSATGSLVESMFSNQGMPAATGFNAPMAGRWTAAAEYGIGLPGDFLGSLRLASTRGAGQQDQTLGYRLRSQSTERDLALEMTLTRSRYAQDATRHSLGTQLAWRLSRESGDRLDLSLELSAGREVAGGSAEGNQFGARLGIFW